MHRSPNGDLIREIMALRQAPTQTLKARYQELFGEESRSGNRVWLWKRIAYRLQELKYGGLSEQARATALELGKNSSLALNIPREASETLDELASLPPRDARLPPPGTILRRVYGGKEHLVMVLDDGFEVGGSRYASLSAVAREITGTRWNGWLFFGLTSRRKTAA